MQCVNMFEAKTTLSKLIEVIERGEEQEVLIARHGRPVARLTALTPQPAEKRLGVAKGKFTVPDSIDQDNAAIAALFHGDM